MPLAQIQIDDDTLAQALPQKRDEWQGLCVDLLQAEDFGFSAQAALLKITCDADAIVLEMRDGQDLLISAESLGAAEWQELRDEYVNTIEQMQNADDPTLSDRLEVLDMAKKATHDRAARWLRKRLQLFELNVATARRLFTLLISLYSADPNMRAHSVLPRS